MDSSQITVWSQSVTVKRNKKYPIETNIRDRTKMTGPTVAQSSTPPEFNRHNH